MFMGYRCNASMVKEIIKIRSFRSKIAQVKSLFGCGTNKKLNMLTIWNYLLFFCFVTSGYATYEVCLEAETTTGN
jgi:hypothetical protein